VAQWLPRSMPLFPRLDKTKASLDPVSYRRPLFFHKLPFLPCDDQVDSLSRFPFSSLCAVAFPQLLLLEDFENTKYNLHTKNTTAKRFINWFESVRTCIGTQVKSLTLMKYFFLVLGRLGCWCCRSLMLYFYVRICTVRMF
jgi:hypothetical protein